MRGFIKKADFAACAFEKWVAWYQQDATPLEHWPGDDTLTPKTTRRMVRIAHPTVSSQTADVKAVVDENLDLVDTLNFDFLWGGSGKQWGHEGYQPPPPGGN